MYDYIGNNWSHRNSNKRFKEKFGSHATKTFNRLTTTTWNITHNTESAAVRKLKPERWGLPLAQKYREEKARDKRKQQQQHNNNNNNNNNNTQKLCSYVKKNYNTLR